MMNRIRVLAIGTILMSALTAVGQQAATEPGSTDKDQQGQHGGVPTAEQHLKLLTEKLDLTADQQTKARPMIQQMLDTRQKIVQDGTMSSEERSEQFRALHQKADKELREILTDDQKKKLDQLEQEPHPELHGNTNGATPPPQN